MPEDDPPKRKCAAGRGHPGPTKIAAMRVKNPQSPIRNCLHVFISLPTIRLCKLRNRSQRMWH
jgi:hypothetical protein